MNQKNLFQYYQTKISMLQTNNFKIIMTVNAISNHFLRRLVKVLAKVKISNKMILVLVFKKILNLSLFQIKISVNRFKANNQTANFKNAQKVKLLKID